MLAGTELECSTVITMREKLLLSALSIDEKDAASLIEHIVTDCS